MLATGAMLVRNGVILAIFSPQSLRTAALPLALMLAAAATPLWLRSEALDTSMGESRIEQSDRPTLPALQSPFSPTAALKFGVLFLALQVTGTIAQRTLGALGFYVVSLAGGVVSSASAVASAASLAAAGTLSPKAAAIGAVLRSRRERDRSICQSWRGSDRIAR